MNLVSFGVSVLLLCIFSNVQAATRIASLNPCFDDWVPQWLPSEHQFIPSTQHGNRLERLLALQPDVILYGTYTNRRLVTELNKTAMAVEVAEPNSWLQWQATLNNLGSELQMQVPLQQWAERQTRQIKAITVTDKSIIFVMPNQYTWGGASFAVDLLRVFGAHVVVLEENAVLHQLRLEELIHLQPQRVVVDGFSSDYARANEWLWHNALQPWLSQRQLRHVSSTVSGCPAQQAATYFERAASL
ncbi:ABC-type Fe3+-hydroxamate transport system, substrate-binding protein [Pseudidiomarina donghaiensis]|nr:ABC-type Fe3+-hydroxamate transport system, substrate-binding protein [Pseudidiomarina donghaiensis]